MTRKADELVKREKDRRRESVFASVTRRKLNGDKTARETAIIAGGRELYRGMSNRTFNVRNLRLT